MNNIRLTQTVAKGGCAAKIAANTLKDVLSGVRQIHPDKNLLGDNEGFDDASIYKINESEAIVETLDFFTPIVDTPKIFGEIAAANALSDVYAMGARPITCLAILAFPTQNLDAWVMKDVLDGAYNKVIEAGANIVGGHSIDDDTLKFGLSVSGLVKLDQIWPNNSAKAGDHLILTKALGTGTLSAALKRNLVSEEQIDDAITSMRQLNNVKDCLNEDLISHINSATDITGYGLLGHAMEMATESSVAFELFYNDLVKFDLAEAFLKKEVLTRAHNSNRLYAQESVQFDKDLEEYKKQLLYDPQTSGGLLLSVSENFSTSICKQLQDHFPKTRIIGRVSSQGKAAINVY